MGGGAIVWQSKPRDFRQSSPCSSVDSAVDSVCDLGRVTYSLNASLPSVNGYNSLEHMQESVSGTQGGVWRFHS